MSIDHPDRSYHFSRIIQNIIEILEIQQLHQPATHPIKPQKIMKHRLILSSIVVGCQAALAINIVEFDLEPTVLLDYVPAPESPGIFPASTTPATIDSAAGLSMNIVFTPNGNDINQIITKSRNLAEIGGNGSGTGLYLNGGEIYFLSKVGGSGSDVATFNDLDFATGGNNLVAYKSSFGPLTEGTEYSIGLIYDPNTTAPTLTLGILPTGGTLSIETVNFTGFEALGSNWFGNRTVSSFVIPGNGGGGTSTDGNPFRDGANSTTSNILALNGTKGPVTVWNSLGSQIAVPLPTSPIKVTTISTTLVDGTGGDPDTRSVTISWESIEEAEYSILTSSDLTEEDLSQWTEIETNFPAATGGNITSFTQTGIPASAPRRFYVIRDAAN
ncbi:hypothetical protein [Haloferula sp.]|uniref:hypothetical protein n=1 Tax=Haloferula sp. TaxID=2497595 RepID=UPI003C71D1D0